jgi:3-dehydroquinate synthase
LLTSAGVEIRLTPTEYSFEVPFRFPVYFTTGAWEPGNRAFVDAVSRLEPDRRHRVLVAVDEQVALGQPQLLGSIEAYFAAHERSLELAGPPMLVCGGEAVKNDMGHALTVLSRINECGIDRQSIVAVIGGGAVLDMVSFAAAIAHRGVRVVRFPTTTLSQGDSGIAVKNSVNLFGKKNFLGSFVPPFAVINDAEALRSLSLRDKIAGVSEAVKVALLKSPTLYRYLEVNAQRIAAGDIEVLSTVCERSAHLHLRHICTNGDPFELGSARPLDFGHWAAHKLESMTNFRLRHGEAVAIGMAIDLTYSELAGHLDRATLQRVLRLLERLGFRLWDEALSERDADGRRRVLSGLREFREHLGGRLHVTLLRALGDGFDVHEMDESTLERVLDRLQVRSETAPQLAEALEKSAS